MEYAIIVKLAKGHAVWLSRVDAWDLPHETARAARYSGRPAIVYNAEDFADATGYCLSAAMANLPGGGK